MGFAFSASLGPLIGINCTDVLAQFLVFDLELLVNFDLS